MTQNLNIKRFFTYIFISLAAICFLITALLWRGLNIIENQQTELTRQQHSVSLIKDIRLHSAEIQQFLTDVGATHRVDGLEEAANHRQAALQGLQELGELHPAVLEISRELQSQISASYETGVKMAGDYLNQGLDSGNRAMQRLDQHNANLNKNFILLNSRLDLDLQQGILKTLDTLHLNRLILLSAAPITIGIFILFMRKTGAMLKKEMDNLASRTTQLNTILNTAASAIITIDKVGRITSFNRAAERIFGYAFAEVRDRNINCLMPPEDAGRHDAYLRQYLADRASDMLGKRRELQGLRKSGEIFPILLRINPMEIEGELFFSGVIDDISETKALQAQLGQAQKLEAIGQLASGVAHEINTPIQYIGDNLSALHDNINDINDFQQQLQQLGDPVSQAELTTLAHRYDLPFILEDSPKAIQQALEGVARVSEIVKAMKTFSHIDAEGTSVSLDLHTALQSAITISRNSYKYVADLETDFADDVGCIEAYANELHQVFLNLIINAGHAIEEKQQGRGLIRVSTRKLDNSNVEVLIADNGKGIPDEIREKVFNLFFTTKPVGKGTGQGLSLAHNIVVEKHHGKLFFDSVAGEGTTFHIQLPLTLSTAN